MAKSKPVAAATSDSAKNYTLNLDKLPKSTGGVRYACEEFTIYLPQDMLKELSGKDKFPESVNIAITK